MGGLGAGTGPGGDRGALGLRRGGTSDGGVGGGSGRSGGATGGGRRDGATGVQRGGGGLGALWGPDADRGGPRLRRGVTSDGGLANHLRAPITGDADRGAPRLRRGATSDGGF